MKDEESGMHIKKENDKKKNIALLHPVLVSD